MSSVFGIRSTLAVDALLCVLMIRKHLEIAPVYQTGENKAAPTILAEGSAAFIREGIVNGPIVSEMKAPTSKAPELKKNKSVCTEDPFTCDPSSQICGSMCPSCPFTWNNMERCHVKRSRMLKERG